MVMIAVATLLQAAVFVDKRTQLMWQDNAASKHLEGDWYDAMDYCKRIQLAGFSDWRLPSVGELYTLIDVRNYDPASIEGLSNVESEDYWSASESVDDLSDAWLVYFEDGVVNHYSKSRERHIRCVRNLQKNDLKKMAATK